MSLKKQGFVASHTSILVLCMFFGPAVLGQVQTAPDNSARNKAQNQSRTADQQKDNASDREMTAKIRRAVVADKSLSTYGHNVKIIVVGGAVTLKGPVHTEAEKQSIGDKAESVAGQGKITNQITVKQ